MNARKSVVVLGNDYKTGSKRSKRVDAVQLRFRDDILKDDTASDYESVDCLCGKNADDVVTSEVERHDLPYGKVICMHCGLLRVNPRWNQNRYNAFYENQYRGLYNTAPKSREEHVKFLATDHTRNPLRLGSRLHLKSLAQAR